MTKTRKQKTVAERKAELMQRQKALIEEQRKKQKQLAAKLAQLEIREKSQVRKQDAHLKIIIGAAVQAHARINATWAKQLYDVLHKAASKDRDVKLIEDWFKRLADEQKKIGPQVVPSLKQKEG